MGGADDYTFPLVGAQNLQPGNVNTVAGVNVRKIEGFSEGSAQHLPHVMSDARPLRRAHVGESRSQMMEGARVPLEPRRHLSPDPAGQVGCGLQRQPRHEPGHRPDDTIFQTVFEISSEHPRVHARLEPQTLLASSLCGWVKPQA